MTGQVSPRFLHVYLHCEFAALPHLTIHGRALLKGIFLSAFDELLYCHQKQHSIEVTEQGENVRQD